jgi:hypothetical protein
MAGEDSVSGLFMRLLLLACTLSWASHLMGVHAQTPADANVTDTNSTIDNSTNSTFNISAYDNMTLFNITDFANFTNITNVTNVTNVTYIPPPWTISCDPPNYGNRTLPVPTDRTRAISRELIDVYTRTGGADWLNITDFYGWVQWYSLNMTNTTNITWNNYTNYTALGIAPNATSITTMYQYLFHLNMSLFTNLTGNGTNFTCSFQNQTCASVQVWQWLSRTQSWVLGWHRRCGWANATENSTDWCWWSGISCDPQGNIIGIDLNNNNLHPPTSVYGLLPFANSAITTLRFLNLSGNPLFGQLPARFGDAWINLKSIDLSNIQMSGILHDGFGDYWYNVSFVYLNNNFIIGPVPPNMARKWYVLSKLDMSLNTLSGAQTVCQCLGACICV